MHCGTGSGKEYVDECILVIQIEGDVQCSKGEGVGGKARMLLYGAMGPCNYINYGQEACFTPRVEHGSNQTDVTISAVDQDGRRSVIQARSQSEFTGRPLRSRHPGSCRRSARLEPRGCDAWHPSVAHVGMPRPWIGDVAVTRLLFWTWPPYGEPLPGQGVEARTSGNSRCE
jgi:hypothetical protein